MEPVVSEYMIIGRHIPQNLKGQVVLQHLQGQPQRIRELNYIVVKVARILIQ